MTLSMYEALEPELNKSFDDIKAKLQEIGVIVFKPLYDKSAREEAEKEEDFSNLDVRVIIAYVVQAYSQESPKLILGVDHSQQKMDIAGELQMPEYLHQKVVKMSSALVRKVIVAYLNLQSSRIFKQLQIKKDVYEAASDNGIISLRGEDGHVDLKEMAEASKYLDKLLVDIVELEDKIRSEYQYVTKNLSDIDTTERKSRRGSNPMGNVEDSDLIT